MRTDTRPVIVHLRASNFVGGPEKQILEHMQRMADSPYRLVLCSYDENDGPSSLHQTGEAFGLECHRLASNGLLSPRVVFDLTKLMVSLEASLLVSHGYKPNILGRLACWRTGVRTLAVSRGWTWENWKIRMFEAVDRLFLRYADHVVAVSQGQRDKILKAGIPVEKVQVIRNAINLNDMPRKDPSMPERNRLGIPSHALLVGTAGRLSPEKNHLGFVQAAAKVAATRDDVHFVVWGEGFMRPQLEQAVRDNGLAERFHLPGFNKDVRKALHELDVFVLPSHTEGLSNVLLEAFACSKPIVATAVGGNPEVVEDGVNGILTPADNSDALAAAILSLCDSPALRVAMGQAGRKRVSDEFDFSSQTERYMSLYRRLLGAGREAA